MRRPDWLVHDEVWFPRAVVVATGVVAVLCAATSRSTGDRVEVLAVGAVTVAGMAARLGFPRLPLPVLLVWTYAPVVLALARDQNEGLAFVLILALMFVQTEAPSVSWRVVAGVLATVVPLGVHLLPDFSLDGWPYWTGGLLLTWFSVEQSLRFQALVVELEQTRDRLAAQAVQLERRRIAAELHDIVGHSLGVILLHVTGARRRIRDDPAAALEALTDAEEIGRASLADMRRNAAALRDLGDDPTAPTPGVDDVALLVAQLRSTGTHVSLEHAGDTADVESIAGLAAYRVVQESLVNSSKHAPGASVHVGLQVRDDAVAVEVSDTGGGAPGGSAHAGVGIAGMRERVEALGGTFAAGPTAHGWRVRADVPRAQPRKATTS